MLEITVKIKVPLRAAKHIITIHLKIHYKNIMTRIANIFKDIRHKIKSGSVVKKGDTLIYFDITLGDALFVDRLSYHFKKPGAGDPFVFKTSKNEVDKKQTSLGDKYFIMNRRHFGENFNR